MDVSVLLRNMRWERIYTQMNISQCQCFPHTAVYILVYLWWNTSSIIDVCIRFNQPPICVSWAPYAFLHQMFPNQLHCVLQIHTCLPDMYYGIVSFICIHIYIRYVADCISYKNIFYCIHYQYTLYSNFNFYLSMHTCTNNLRWKTKHCKNLIVLILGNTQIFLKRNYRNSSFIFAS